MFKKSRLLALPFTLLAAASQAAPLPICPGVYEASWGNVTLSADGTATLAGTPGTTRLTLSVQDCDTATLEGDGQRMALVRRGADYFQGEINGGGAHRVFDIHFTTPAQAIALMTAQGGGLQGQRGMSLRLIEASATPAPSCSQSTTEEGPLSRDAEAAMLWAEARGLAPASGYDIGDYIIAEATFDPRRDVVAHRVSFDLGLAGEILPQPDAEERTAVFCDPDLFLNPPRYLLNFKIFDLAPGVTVFAQIIDIETGKITAQAEGRADGTDAAAVAHAMTRASEDLGAQPLGPMTSGLTRR